MENAGLTLVILIIAVTGGAALGLPIALTNNRISRWLDK